MADTAAQTQTPPKEGQKDQPKEAPREKAERMDANGEKENGKVDPKAYYGYLFEKDKKPTKVLDALLRGVAGYISEHIGDPEQKNLTPDKMAAFYKAVGGNYDSLFVALPPPSISWIYASIGCQHTLQPHPQDDFIPPCIPALTTRGFVRWQSIEILLGPEEHVPFILTALHNFNLRHPDTGELFPVDLPSSAFPEHADPEIEAWHEQCAKALRRRATPRGEDEGSMDDVGSGGRQPRPKVQRGGGGTAAGFAHVSARPRTEYFDRQRGGGERSGGERSGGERGGRVPPVSFQHVSSTPGAAAAAPPPPARPRMSQSPSHRARQFLAPEDTAGTRGRRRSFPSPVEDDLRRPDVNGRRHSHSHSGGHRKRRGSVSSDASSEDESDVSPSHTPGHHDRRERSRSHPNMRAADFTDARRPSRSGERERTDIPPPGVRYAVPLSRRERERERDREEELKRRSYPTPLSNPNVAPNTANTIPIPVDPSGKLSTPFMAGKRPPAGVASGQRSDSHSRGGVRWKDLDATVQKAKDLWHRGGGGGRDSEEEPARRERRERDRERDTRKGSYEDSGNSSGRRDRDRDGRERELSSRGEGRSYRDRERDRDRDREGRERRYTSGGSGPDRERSPIRGVDGRRYP